MSACAVCGTEQTVTTYCVVVDDYHVTYGSEFIKPDDPRIAPGLTCAHCGEPVTPGQMVERPWVGVIVHAACQAAQEVGQTTP